ncbi:TadE/TadG family type IV pilus assembly protein [Geodermatophilus sp. SYSU D00758]
MEFALVLPVLLILALGIVEFGRAFQTQATLAAAAREGVRILALKDDSAEAIQAAQDVSTSLDPGLTSGNITPIACGGGDTATVRITYTQTFMTGLFGPGIPLTAEGVMRCHG